MTAHVRLAWLALTPEPERELPVAVARLRSATAASAAHAAPAASTTPAAYTTASAARAAAAARAAPAALTAHAVPGRPEIELERRRVEKLILHGTARAWRRYLHGICELIRCLPPAPPAAVRRDALLVGEVVLEHHRMLIGLPGPGYRETEADRGFLTETIARLRAEHEGGFEC